MEKNNLKVLGIVLLISLLVTMVAGLVTCTILVPRITEHDFSYSVTYKLDGQTKTLKGIYHVKFDSSDLNMEPWDRYYIGSHLTNPNDYTDLYTIAEQDDYKLCISVNLQNGYLMGEKADEEEVLELSTPCLIIYDQDQVSYDYIDTADQFDVELVSWELPRPVKNSLVFKGFGYAHAGTMVTTILTGILGILACMIFVKKEQSVSYKILDKISIVLNFLIVFVALPVIYILVSLFELVMSADDLIYQMYLSIPALTAFTVAASLGFRRKGFSKSGFFVQFVGPVLFVALCVAETVFYNLFG